jgi:putative Mg2+ transporter-C (MgtC) family protein
MIATADLEILGKAALAAALAFLIGWERERSGHPAGDRTFALVAMGAAVLTAISLDVFPASADRVIAGAVTGVGFLGAGMILRPNSGQIRGLTTAACIWAVDALGIVVGAGHYLLGVSLGALILLILEWERLPVLNRLGYGNARSPKLTDQDD